MNKRLAAQWLTAALLLSTHHSYCQTHPANPTNTVSEPKKISIQGALAFGPTPMKMHALSAITQGKIAGEVDASFLPGFIACSQDSSPAIRSIAAKMLGEYFIQNQLTPNPEALKVLEKLAQDPSADVRFNALFYGLTKITPKSEHIIKKLVDAAAVNREEGLYDKIIESLSDNKKTAASYIQSQLKSGTSIAYYEIYKDLLQTKPENSDIYRDMPSSQPQLLVFTSKNEDKNAAADTLKKWVEKLGIDSSFVEVSGYAGQRVLLLTTYITKDNENVQDNIANLPEGIDYMSKFWLTPKLAADIEMVRKRDAK